MITDNTDKRFSKEAEIFKALSHPTRILILYSIKDEQHSVTELAEQAARILKPHQHWIHTITSDNGKEFAEHQKISQDLKIKFYFAQPYHSWERGSNENLNGLIRQYIPKGVII